VTGEIPYGKLQQFLNAEQKRILAVNAQPEGSEGAAAAVKKGGQGASRQKQRWYTRAMMWEMGRKLDTEERRAARGDLHGLAGLTDFEYEQCLEQVHGYFAKNPSLRRSGQRVFLKPNMGPASSAQRETAVENYNGDGGGRVFKWYHQAYMLHELAGLGVSVKTATEAQVMKCLRSVSWRLRFQPAVSKQLEEYGGPQCFPQFFERERWRAGQRKRPTICGEDGESVAERFKQCWRKCDKCEKLRVVREDCLDALSEDAFKRQRGDRSEVDWRQWMQTAKERYGAFLAKQGLKPKKRVKCSEQVGIGLQAGLVEFEDEEPALQEFRGDDDTECEDDEPSRDFEGADDNADIADDEAENDITDSSEEDWEEILRTFGSHAGPWTDADKAEQAIAESSEQALEVHILFECRMLQRLEGAGDEQRWVTMTCQDEDDFKTLKQKVWPVEAFRENASVVLWKSDANAPVGREGFARSGVIGRGWTGGVTRNAEKLAIRVDAESKFVNGEKAEWSEIPELQVSARGVGDCGVTLTGPWDVGERGQRMIVGGSAKQRKGQPPLLDCLPAPPRAAASVAKRYAKGFL
jgi:hypothetical protein